MKSVRYIFSIIGFFVFLGINIYACEINFEVVDGKKQSYSNNDQLVVKVTVETTHRNCGESVDNVKLNTKGADILSATKWKESSPGVWERKLKVKINNPKNGKSTLNAVRQCKKDGGSATLTLTAK